VNARAGTLGSSAAPGAVASEAGDKAADASATAESARASSQPLP